MVTLHDNTNVNPEPGQYFWCWSTGEPLRFRYVDLERSGPYQKTFTYHILQETFTSKPVRWHDSTFAAATMDEEVAYEQAINYHESEMEMLREQLANIRKKKAESVTST
jgi:hypothetical protein